MYNIFSQLSFGVIQVILDFLGNIAVSFTNYFFEIVKSYFSSVLYGIAMGLFLLVDLFQTFFKKLAGLEPHYVKGVETNEDILFTFLSNQNVLNVLLGMGIVAIFMVIFATIIQIIRSEYTAEGAKNTKGNILALTFKSFVMFLTVPVACVLGIYVSNALLRSVNAAFGDGTSVYASGAIFRASASQANRLIIAYDSIDSPDIFANWPNFADAIKLLRGNVVNSNKDGFKPGADNGGTFVSNKIGVDKVIDIANKVDSAFANKEPNKNYGSTDPEAMFTKYKNFSYMNIDMVATYYDLAEINYLVLYVSGLFTIYIFLIASFGLIMRIFKIVLLFIISPPIIALMPMDNGKSYQQWRTSFLGAVISAYGVVVGLNAFFLIMTVFNKSQITLFPTYGIEGYLYREANYIINLLFLCVGIFLIKDFSKLVSGFIGSGDADALGAGAGMAKQVGKVATTVAGGTIKYGTNWAARAFNMKKINDLTDQSAGYAKEAEDAELEMRNYLASNKKHKEKDDTYQNLVAKRDKALANKRQAEEQAYLHEERLGALKNQGLRAGFTDWTLKKLGSKEGMKEINEKYKPKYFNDDHKAEADKRKMESTLASRTAQRNATIKNAALGYIQGHESTIEAARQKYGTKAERGNEKQIKSQFNNEAKAIESSGALINKIMEQYYNVGGFNVDGVVKVNGKTYHQQDILSLLEDYKGKVEVTENDHTNDLLRAINESIKALQSRSALSQNVKEDLDKGVGKVSEAHKNAGENVMKQVITSNVVSSIKLENKNNPTEILGAIKDELDKKLRSQSNEKLKDEILDGFRKEIDKALKELNESYKK